jgi:hypothetical protein
MRVSLAESDAHGFNKWCATHDVGGTDKSRLRVKGATAEADPDLEPAVTAPPERPTSPVALFPARGRLNSANTLGQSARRIQR